MKKIVLICTILIVATSSFSQNAGTSSMNRNLSPKERMKMQVVGIKPNAALNIYSTPIFNQNFTAKESMKLHAIKVQPTAFIIGAPSYSNECRTCQAISRLSPKERMKALVVRLNKCSMPCDVRNCCASVSHKAVSPKML